MMKILGRGAMAALPILILMSACSSEPAGLTNLSDDEQVNLDVARYVADVTGDDILLMTYEADFVMRRDFGRAAAEGGETCHRGIGRQFRCKGGVFGGGFGSGSMSFTREVTFYDSEGEMDWYDATETISINFYVSLTGERSSEWGSMTVNRERDFTVSGLYEDETSRIWNGWGKSDRNRTRYSDENGDRTYYMSGTTTVTNVVIPVPRSWPEEGGTIKRTVTVVIVTAAGDTETKTRDVLIVFNGTQYVPITINDETYILDLATRRIDRGGDA
jgi:hypothetical protein